MQNPTMKRYILDKKGTFFQKYGLNNVISFIVEKLTHCLGHGAVATFPDRPFLEWRFEFDRARPSGEKESHRNNRTTFLDGCEKLHACFVSMPNRNIQTIRVGLLQRFNLLSSE